MKRTATISQCQQFRYLLSRDWNDAMPRAAFIMLNPSTADADIDDPTIRKCITFAKNAGMGSLDVVNLFAYRATKPADMKKAGWLRGPENDAYIERAVKRAAITICAWGANARDLGRQAEVRALLKAWCVKPHALRLLFDGVPEHPLMLPYSCKLLELKW